MDNLHQIIMLVLVSFGTGHITLKAKFGFITLSLLAVFFFLIYTQFQSDQTKIIAVTSFIAGIAYAKDIVHFNFIGDALYWFKGLFSSKKLFKRKPQQSASSQRQTKQTNTQKQWQEEQARREQAARSQRKRNSYQEEPETDKKKEPPKQEQTKKEYHQQSQKESIEESKPNTDTRSNLEILGLSPGFTQEELKKAYRRERARCHPDKWVSKPEYIRKAMEEEQKLVNKAYKELNV